jgi:hypothetical protein
MLLSVCSRRTLAEPDASASRGDREGFINVQSNGQDYPLAILADIDYTSKRDYQTRLLYFHGREWITQYRSE